jgi:hypothetical protein
MFFGQTATGPASLRSTIKLPELCDDYLFPLFANPKNDGKESTKKFTDLVAERIIGIATVLDVLRFLAEGLRCPFNTSERDVWVRLPADDMEHMPVAASYLAMGLVQSVFPQLDALPLDRLKVAVEHIIGVFRKADGDVPFKRIELVEHAKEEDKFRFKLERVRAITGGVTDGNRDGTISIPELLVGELCLQFRGTGHEVWLREIVEQRAAP